MTFYHATFTFIGALLAQGIVYGATAWAQRPDIKLIALPGTEARVVQFTSATLPTMMDFLDQWGQVTDIPKKLTIVFSTPGMEQNQELYRRLFGSDYEAKARDLLQRTELAQSGADWDALLSDFSCQFPTVGLSKKLWITGDRGLISGLPSRFLKARMAEDLQAILDKSVKPRNLTPVFTRSTATMFSSYHRDCHVIVFGASKSSISIGGSETFHRIINSEDSQHTVLHELSHWIDATSKITKGAFYPSQGFGEALADTMTSLYLQSPCHKTAGYSVGNQCSRDFTTTADFPDPISVSFPETDIYQRGQPLRYRVWPLIKGQSIRSRGLHVLQARDISIQSATEIQTEDILSGAFLKLAYSNLDLQREDLAIMKQFILELEKLILRKE